MTKVDVIENKETMKFCNVEATPTFLFYIDGKKVDTMVGGEESRLKSKITEFKYRAEMQRKLKERKAEKKK